MCAFNMLRVTQVIDTFVQYSCFMEEEGMLNEQSMASPWRSGWFRKSSVITFVM